jgi:hypothetical protein
LLAQPSYSDYEFGYSNNAALGNVSWGMSSGLLGVDSMEGVDINGVVYRYTAVKEPSDPYTVSISNEDTINGGYIFRETDDWSGTSGGTINKFLPLQYTPAQQFGLGRIETVGLGSIEEPSVIYSYRVTPNQVTPIAVPQVPVIELYDALDDAAVTNALSATDRSLFETNDRDSEQTREERARKAADNAEATGLSVSQTSLISAMNMATNMTPYYSKGIPGGQYNDSLTLTDATLPDNSGGRRLNLAQQALHSELVNSQYRR